MKIEFEGLAKMPRFLSDIENKALPQANRTALNKSLITLQKEMVRNIRLNYNLKSGELKKSYMTRFRAKGNKLNNQEAALKVSGRPISMIRFMSKSQSQPEDQSGKSIKQRRKLRVQIKPGNKRKSKTLFVQKGKGGVNHVFRRAKKGSDKRGIMTKQSVPGLTRLMDRVSSIRRESQARAEERYARELQREFKYRVERLGG